MNSIFAHFGTTTNSQFWVTNGHGHFYLHLTLFSMHDPLLQEQQSLDMTQDFLSIKCKLKERVHLK